MGVQNRVSSPVRCDLRWRMAATLARGISPYWHWESARFIAEIDSDPELNAKLMDRSANEQA
jgi:hypothetical protein